MIGTTGAGWLFSLAAGSNWGAIEDFYAAVGRSKRRKGKFIVESDVWGTLRSLAAVPVPGDGLAFYHSTRATFPPHDQLKRKPRISLMGELLDIKLAGRDLKRIRVAVDAKMLSALKSHPIVRDDSSKGLFESCGIVPGAVATLYHADYPTWSALVARIDRHAI